MFFRPNTNLKYKVSWLCRNWILGWIDLFAALVAIFTFGRVYPSWGFKWICFWEIRNLKKRQRENENG